MRNVIELLVLVLVLLLATGGGSRSLAQQLPGRQAELPGEPTAGQQKPGYLGVEMRDVTADEAKGLGLNVPTGVWVTKPVPGAPAAQAGLQPGDLLLSVDGVEMTGTEAFRTAVGGKGAGARVKFRLLRQGRPQTLIATLGERPSQPAAQFTGQMALVTEFAVLLEKSRNTDDPEAKIAALESALRIEPQLELWPLPIPRDFIKGMLLGVLAESYWYRRQGSESDNQEAAIKAYEAALTVHTREAFSNEWVYAQNGLALAFRRRIRGSKADNLEAEIKAYEAVLTVHTREAFPKQWAATQNDLAIAYGNRIRGSKADNLDMAIKGFEASLTVLTREAFPNGWAGTQHNLASAYRNRIRGLEADNLEAAIKAYEAALTVYTRDTYPNEWAASQNNLAVAYGARIRGSKADNLERAIEAHEAALTVLTREAFPDEWATIQANLANDYTQRFRGSKADNLEAAIEAYGAALTVSAREASPQRWGSIQSNLAAVYINRIRGNRADNLELAIKACEAALTISSRDAFPQEWARTQQNLAIAYISRIHGPKADNLEAALKAVEASLTIRTREAYPKDWAASQNSLAIIYVNRMRGSKADNLEAAIEAYGAALTVHTPEAFPDYWARTQNNLAAAYSKRIRGSKADNLEMAIKAYDAALTVRTREAYPKEWAVTQDNLALAYRNRIHGSKADNLELAIKAHEAALTVHTREAFPRDHLRTAQLLGAILLEKRDWQAATGVFAEARAAFALLFGQGLESAEAQDLIGEAGPLFAQMAFVAAQSGDLPGAFDVLVEGKARLMAVALRQQSIELPPDKRVRHTALQAEIGDLQSIAENTPGEEGTRALQNLIALRRELGDLLAATTKTESSNVLSSARRLAPVGGAIVAPVVTTAGGKLLVVRSAADGGQLSVIDLPQLTTRKLFEAMKGPVDDPIFSGWLGAFGLQYLPPDQRKSRWGEWLGAIDNIGYQIWDLIGGAVDAELQRQGLSLGAKLVWMPAGALGMLPIGLAQDPATGRRLGDTYEITHAPNIDGLIAAERVVAEAATPRLVAIVNPTGDLPFTETESAMISAHFPSAERAKLDQTNAEPAAVLDALKDRSYWHFSSHGAFDWSDPRRAALLMKGKEPLTVKALLDQQGQLGRPRLVVLSACETGLFDIDRNPDEFVGLPATFIQLGAAGVVSTLWQVDDLATSLLMARFYELHLIQGHAPPSALKEAQAWLRGATKAELIGYAKGVGARSGVDVGRLTRVEVALTTRRDAGRSDARAKFAETWTLLQTKAEAAVTALGRSWTDAENLRSRPFEHPYYWGGFTYTGL